MGTTPGRNSTAHGRDEGNFVIILEGRFAVNVLLIDGEGHAPPELAERRVLAAQDLPQGAYGRRAGHLPDGLGSAGALAERGEKPEA
jgi:hypothetical protein